MKKNSRYWLFNSIRSKFESAKEKYERERATAQYLLVSPTNCGRTWLRLILGKSFQLFFNLTEDINLFYLYGFSEINSTIPSIKASHEKYIGYHEYRYRRIILLVRDPRDAIVSKYFGMIKRVKKIEEDQISLFDYFQKEGLNYYISFYNEWNQHKNETMGVLLVRYEDLKENTHREVKNIVKFIGLEIPDKIINTAIEYASFDNMRKMEAQGQSKSGVLKAGNPQDSESYKTRKGKVGGFKEYLSVEEIALIEKEINDNLDPFFGYNYYS
ncbi:MAG: sulfotransferase domain-containing protein [Cyanobacteriota bacterium]|nr:sulfotransferase domain-containing protein [Cyanobacteriota bacterium]